MDGLIQNTIKEKDKQEKKQDSTIVLIEKSKPQIKMALPNDYDHERFTRIAKSILKVNPELIQCEPMSFLSALMTSAQLGLEPNTPMQYAYIIPYKGKATFQIGYQGLLNLMYRSPRTLAFYATEVRDTDDYLFEKGTEPKIYHKINIKNRGEVIAYYAVYKTVDGVSTFDVMSKEEVEKHRNKYSKYKNSPAWTNSFDAMALKTVAIKTLKFVPKDVEITRIMALDDKVRNRIDKDMTEVEPEEDFIDMEPTE